MCSCAACKYIGVENDILKEKYYACYYSRY
jgi:hypothetical protein